MLSILFSLSHSFPLLALFRHRMLTIQHISGCSMYIQMELVSGGQWNSLVRRSIVGSDVFVRFNRNFAVTMCFFAILLSMLTLLMLLLLILFTSLCLPACQPAYLVSFPHSTQFNCASRASFCSSIEIETPFK